MASEEEKAKLEIDFFLRFLVASELPYDANSANKRNPPEPDILCVHATEGPVAFELMEICDSNLAESIFHAGKGGSTYLRTSDPTEKLLIAKSQRKYRTSYPIELVCYTHGRVITPLNVMVPRMRLALQSARKSPFRRVWLFSRKQVQQVWPVL